MESREQDESRHICLVLSQQIKGLGMAGSGLGEGFILDFVDVSVWDELWGQRFPALARSRAWSSWNGGLGSLTDKPRIPPCTEGTAKARKRFHSIPNPLGLGSPAHLWLSLFCCASKSLWPLSPSALNLILAVFPVVIELH